MQTLFGEFEMLKLIAITLLVYGTIAHGAGTKLLDCNTGGGPDQQVTVEEEGGKLTLIELTSQGAVVKRDLLRTEWNSQVLQLRDGTLGEKTTLSKKARGWFYESRGPGVNEMGYADCEIEPSAGESCSDAL
jgi:hypothetical protein